MFTATVAFCLEPRGLNKLSSYHVKCVVLRHDFQLIPQLNCLGVGEMIEIFNLLIDMHHFNHGSDTHHK